MTALDNYQHRVIFFQKLNEAFPDVRIELEYSDPFTLLIAVVLSARCTDKAVNAALPGLFADGSTPQDMLRLGEDEIASRIKTIGCYRNKAKFITGIAEQVMELGGVPDNLEQLEKLPGVGRKTANIILSVAFGHTTFAVDTHVFRVSNRTGLAPGKNPRAVEEQLERRVPAQCARTAHALLVLHGRYVCKAQRPKCAECNVQELCDFPHKNVASEKP